MHDSLSWSGPHYDRHELVCLFSPPESLSKRMNFKDGWQGRQVLKVQLLPKPTSENWAENCQEGESGTFYNSPEEVEDKILDAR